MGNRMPAEWERHGATWLAWPYGDESFAERIPAVEAAYLAIIRALSPRERVRLIVLASQKNEIEEKITDAGVPLSAIDIIEADYADVWTRDWGPTFVETGGRLAFVKWTYNAYGNKFPSLLKDDRVIERLTMLADLDKIDAGLVMEGGAVEVNGAGIVLTTEETLLNPNRNPGLSKSQTEAKVAALIGASKFIWLKRGLVNDHTDGHIDEIARFADEHTILYAWEDSGENHGIMEENLAILRGARGTDGNPFALIPLPLPKMFHDDGTRAPASYCNFYIANGVVLVPEFDDANDEPAKKILRDAFPGREIIGIRSKDLICGGGGIHCVTQQEPRVA